MTISTCLFCSQFDLHANATRQYSTILTCRDKILVYNQPILTPVRLKKLMRVQIYFFQKQTLDNDYISNINQFGNLFEQNYVDLIKMLFNLY